MSFADLIYQALTGRHAGPAGFGDQLAAIREAAGSGRKAAKALGIGETTWRRWNAGATPRMGRDTARQLVESAYRQLVATPEAVQRWRNNGMVINTVDASGRRTFTAKKLRLAPDTGTKVVDAFLSGNDQGAVAAFQSGIRDEWYRNQYFGKWSRDPALAHEGATPDDSDSTWSAIAGVS